MSAAYIHYMSIHLPSDLPSYVHNTEENCLPVMEGSCLEPACHGFHDDDVTTTRCPTAQPSPAPSSSSEEADAEAVEASRVQRRLTGAPKRSIRPPPCAART